jgi:hypothetical protein
MLQCDVAAADKITKENRVKVKCFSQQHRGIILLVSKLSTVNRSMRQTVNKLTTGRIMKILTHTCIYTNTHDFFLRIEITIRNNLNYTSCNFLVTKTHITHATTQRTMNLISTNFNLKI